MDRLGQCRIEGFGIHSALLFIAREAASAGNVLGLFHHRLRPAALDCTLAPFVGREFGRRDMAALRQLVEQYETILILDAASARIQVGWVSSNTGARWQTSDAEAGVGLFECIQQLGVEIGTAKAFVFCDGPGSILGIRTAAMAMRTWQVLCPRPVYAYCSLALIAETLDDPATAVIADARRDLWHCFQRRKLLRRITASELPQQLVMPTGFRHWSRLPAGVRAVPYDVASLFARTVDAPLLRSVDAPDAFLHEEPSYVTWTPQIHRAPTPS